MAGFVVVLDANVLCGIEVTDIFATMAVQRIFRPHWSPQILEEVAGTSPSATTSIRRLPTGGSGT